MTTKAQEGWNKTREGRWQVAEEAWAIVQNAEHGDGAADAFGSELNPPISRATVYRLARAERRYQELYKVYGDGIVPSLKFHLTDNYFEAVADLPPSSAYEYLLDALENRLTIETFRALIPSNGDLPDGVGYVISAVEKMYAKPQFNINTTTWRIVSKLLMTSVRLVSGASMNIIQKMIDDKIASNPFQASHIANGLKLYELKNDAEKIERYKLYRKWRDAGESSKVAYANAIAGKQLTDLLEFAESGGNTSSAGDNRKVEDANNPR